MQREFDLVAIREQVNLVTKGADLKEMVNQFIIPAGETYKASIRDDLALEESLLRIVIEREKVQSSSVAYYLAVYLHKTREKFFEQRAIGAINSPDKDVKFVGAVLLDLNSGFREVLNPVILGDQTFFEASSGLNSAEMGIRSLVRANGLSGRTVSNRELSRVVESAARKSNESRILLKQDPTGFLLLEMELKRMRKVKVSIVGGVREFEIAGAELAVEVYKEVYPEAERIGKSVLSSEK